MVSLSEIRKLFLSIEAELALLGIEPSNAIMFKKTSSTSDKGSSVEIWTSSFEFQAPTWAEFDFTLLIDKAEESHPYRMSILNRHTDYAWADSLIFRSESLDRLMTRVRRGCSVWVKPYLAPPDNLTLAEVVESSRFLSSGFFVMDLSTFPGESHFAFTPIEDSTKQVVFGVDSNFDVSVFEHLGGSWVGEKDQSLFNLSGATYRSQLSPANTGVLLALRLIHLAILKSDIRLSKTDLTTLTKRSKQLLKALPRPMRNLRQLGSSPLFR